MPKNPRQENLNKRLITDDGSQETKEKALEYAKPNNTKSSGGEIECYFRNLETHLNKKIKQYPVIVGCVAWLSNKLLLKTLATRKAVSIIIQKEDFLRPDSNDNRGKKLKPLYKQLPHIMGGTKREFYWGDIVDNLDIIHGWESESVRWMGNFNTDKKPAFPRMHNKFLVFCEVEKYKISDEWEPETIIPKAVWTGSFNLSHNSTNSLENALFINNEEIVKAYYDEWQYIFALSERITDEDWELTWHPPSFRIGT